MSFVRFPVTFPSPDPLSTEGLSEDMRFRASLHLQAGRHAPLMRVLGTLSGAQLTQHLVDLATLGAIHAYRLAHQPAGAPSTTPLPDTSASVTPPIELAPAAPPGSGGSSSGIAPEGTVDDRASKTRMFGSLGLDLAGFINPKK